MSRTDTELRRPAEDQPRPDELFEDEIPALPQDETDEHEGPRPTQVIPTCIAVFLSVGAAGWMCAGIFRGFGAQGVAILGAVLGAGTVAYSYRMRRPGPFQYLTLPAALVCGALLMVPDLKGGTASLPGLVSEALRVGGIAQPPIPFDPGWRFLLVVLLAVLAAGSSSLSLGWNLPRLGVFVPVPLMFTAALVQPKGAGIASVVVGLVMFVASLAVSYGVELAREGASSGQFELRRLISGGSITLLLVLGLVGLSRLGFLFPEPTQQQVVPPKKPEIPPPQPDRVLFTVKSERAVPWRLGVLDVYDDRAWLMPPFDTERLKKIPRSGVVPGTEARGEKTTATFTINDVEGHVVPSLANPQKVDRGQFAVEYDSRTQNLRLPDQRPRKGMTYSIEATQPPDGRALSEAPPAPEPLKEFLEAPRPPAEVALLLADAPQSNAWDRLQYVRSAFYQKVVAAGAGNPVDLPPERVAEMLQGKEATPFEITAAEALLARWAGVPARVGYGFFGGERLQGDQEFEIHPRHGATWLEAYFEGHGWVPIVGLPPRAKASLSQEQKKSDPTVKPTDELALVVYVPIKLLSVQLLYVTVRYWLGVTLPFLAAAATVWAFYPGFLKGLRRIRRKRWADERGVRERVAVAYTEFRDSCYDSNIGHPTHTPLEFLRSIQRDDQHIELAWLVTRCLWGDLTRQPLPADAEAAEEMAASLARRLRRAQPLIARMLAVGSRGSLRDPYSHEIPNLWPRIKSGTGAREPRRAKGLVRLLRRLLPAGASLLALALILTACAEGEVRPRQQPSAPILNERLVPETLGDLRFQREAQAEENFSKAGEVSLVTAGRIFTIRRGNDIRGYLEIATFKPGIRATWREVREGVIRSIASGKFERTRVSGERFYELESEQRFLLWFPPDGGTFQLLVAQRDFEDAARVFAAVLAYQRGEDLKPILEEPSVPLPDPRRGEEY